MSFQTRKTFVHLQKTNWDIFDEILWWNLFDEIFDETTVLLMWKDMRVINDRILTSKYLLWVFFGKHLTCKMPFHELKVPLVRMVVHVKLL